MWVVQVKQLWRQFENEEYAHGTMVSIVLSVLVQQRLSTTMPCQQTGLGYAENMQSAITA